MNNLQRSSNGLKKLVKKCRMQFRTPENTDYYAKDDYREAERKYVRFCLSGDSSYADTGPGST